MNLETHKLISFLLIDLKWDQKRLAKHLKISPPTLSKLLCGHYSPSYKKMSLIYAQLKVILKKKKQVIPDIDDFFPELKLIPTDMWQYYRGRFYVI